MATEKRKRLDQRVAATAEAVLAERGHVTAIDVLVALGWLTPRRVDEWRQGRVDYLERVVQADLSKVSAAMTAFRAWARERELNPSETAYVAQTRDRRTLRFSKSGDAGIERAYRTLWVSPGLSERKRERLAERQGRPPDIVVISPLNDWSCRECAGTGDLLLMEGAGPLCLPCADLDELVFLPSGDAALTRRARKASPLSAVVVRFSRARKRYERQGALVDELALELAETQCLADAEARDRRRRREQDRRAAEDEGFQAEFAREVIRLFPGCPAERAQRIARHAGARGSGRVGRSAAGRALAPEAIRLAVAASVRHADTRYDELLMSGINRTDARNRVRADVDKILAAWEAPSK